MFGRFETLRQLGRYIIIIGIVLTFAACGGSGTEIVYDLESRTDYMGLDTGDMNMDGLNDIVVASELINYEGDLDQGFINVFLQDTENPGTFHEQLSFSVPSSPMYLKLADLNNDGLLDVIATMGYSDDSFVVLMNDMLNEDLLEPPQSYSTAAEPFHLDVGDMNRDGLLDVVIAAADYTVLHQQATTGSFGAAQIVGPGYQSVAISDIDRDGLLDVVTLDPGDSAEGNILYYRQQVAMPGSFNRVELLHTGASLEAVAAGDLNDDGLADIAACGFSSRNYDFYGLWCYFLQTSPVGVTFGPKRSIEPGSSGWAWAIEIADLDGDNRNDVILGEGNAADPHRIYVYRQSASGTFSRTGDYQLPENVVDVPILEIYAVSALDLNGDSLPDIAVGNDELFVLFQNPEQPGTFYNPTRIAAQR